LCVGAELGVFDVTLSPNFCLIISSRLGGIVESLSPKDPEIRRKIEALAGAWATTACDRHGQHESNNAMSFLIESLPFLRPYRSGEVRITIEYHYCRIE
jgi:hypothetical protein